MKKHILLIAISLNICINISALQVVLPYDLKEITVVSPRENLQLQSQPVSFSTIAEDKIEKGNINNLHDLSALVPNFFMPEYGSKITSSIYIRGIGSRMNEPSVGMYVDNIPYLDKSAFDFDFYDIKQIDLLRGPQGTLYGRNSIGGLINITTLSPFNYQGTKLFASYANENDQTYRFSHYQKVTNKIGFSLAGYYHVEDGFFTNEFNEKSDWTESFGGRGKFEWKINPVWKMDLSLLFDKAHQNAYPYAAYDINSGETGNINYNEEGGYKRDLFVTGLSFQRRTYNMLFTSATSYQYMDDKMSMDQDFTADSIYKLTQNQTQHTVTQEFVLRSAGSSNYQWVTGLFGFYKGLDVDAPMLFRKGGLDIIQEKLPPFIQIENNEMDIPGLFKTPAYGAALYHQSSYKLWDKLTITAGLRVEYEKTSMDYNTSANIKMKITPPGMPVSIPFDSTYTISGDMSQEFWQLLPKIALKYDFNDQYSVYASVSKGYKTGGFNFQMFSDVLSNKMQQMPSMPGTPPSGGNTEEVNLKDIISYKPETTINYEIGTHTEIIRNKLFIDAALFYIDYSNQQIVTFSSTNTGSRMMENAGSSESMGAELAARAYLKNFSATISYGYTKATFKDYNNGEQDYSGNYIPLVPRNTFSAGIEYKWKINRSFLDNIVFNIQYNAFGKMYFTEENLISQDFYGILNGSIRFEKNKFSLTCWSNNLLDEDYNIFYFKSLNNSFMQKGKPRQLGLSAQFSF